MWREEAHIELTEVWPSLERLIIHAFPAAIIVVVFCFLYNGGSISKFLTAALTPVQEREITSDMEYSLAGNEGAISAVFTGKVMLNSDDSLVRVLLVDSQNKEYLVYEANSVLNKLGKDEKVAAACEETCDFGPVNAAKLKIKIVDARFLMDSFQITSVTALQKASSQEIQKAALIKAQDEKFERLKSNMSEKQMTWVAGQTPVSRLTYEEKKKLFVGQDGLQVKDLPNLHGFEYYKVGVFKLAGGDFKSEDSLNLPASWDWRFIGGENWNTPVKNWNNPSQRNVAADVIESQINLYFGQHADANMLKQQALGWQPWQWNYSGWIKQAGNSTQADVKKIIIQKGPVSSGIRAWNHAMELEGYGVAEINGEPLFYWLFKNSWSSGWGDAGYVKIAGGFGEPDQLYLPLGPFEPPADKSYWPVNFSNSPNPWFYSQSCDDAGKSPAFSIIMGFKDGRQLTVPASCPLDSVCLETDPSGLAVCSIGQ